MYQTILTIVSSLSLLLPFSYGEVTYINNDTNDILPIPIKEEKAVLREELVKICACESGNGTPGSARQFYEDGSVVRGKVDPLDTGKCQISKRYWLDMSDKLGYDIETDEGNTLMANWIYDNYGTEPWKWSKSCWNK